MSQNDFGALGVPSPLVERLAATGITSAFPIQVATLPDTLAGRDVLGRGKTGSGKTLAFALPLVTRLAQASRQPAGGRGHGSGRTRPGHPRGLVLAPTRELATQIAAVFEPLAGAYDLTVTTIFGGVSQNRQVSALRAGVDIVIACPGRLEDLMNQGHANLGDVSITVLDEADHMADLGFLPVVTRIMNRTPSGGQRMLFSATLDNGVDALVRRYLKDELRHSVDSANSPVSAMTHRVFEVADVTTKRDVVQALASGTGRRILFMRTKHQAKKLARQLTAAGIPSVDLHGNLSQNQRDRNLKAFTDGTSSVLVATDVAARGVHVDDVELVVHVDPPAEHKSYLHRSGRTARAGSEGSVLTLVLPEQRRDTHQLMRKAKISVKPESVTATSGAVTALVGEVAAYVEPPAPAQPQQRANAGRGRSGGRGRGGAPHGGSSSGAGGSSGPGRRRRSRGHSRSGAPRGRAGGSQTRSASV
ncbi:DEAD/DEAH box helicase [Pseudactinotalea sp. Z1732]|uniref:DEAD/DEAH box helicase n=1 Tax=Micrococcales TaxID=85006 RepID=UPI003C7E8045